MKENLALKRALITQSLCPVFLLLLIRHFHMDYLYLVPQFIRIMKNHPFEAVIQAFCHIRFGELLICILSIIWIVSSLISMRGFTAIQNPGFESHGEQVIAVEEKRDAAASFLMTFILPLLIDELSSPQKWISYILVIVVVYSILYQSNLYYQSPILALMHYKVFSFKVINPDNNTGFKKDTEYIGITRKRMITEEAAIRSKHIADNVYLVYNEGFKISEKRDNKWIKLKSRKY